MDWACVKRSAREDDGRRSCVWGASEGGVTLHVRRLHIGNFLLGGTKRCVIFVSVHYWELDAQKGMKKSKQEPHRRDVDAGAYQTQMPRSGRGARCSCEQHEPPRPLASTFHNHQPLTTGLHIRINHVPLPSA
jgi:hypothetical protein